MASKKKPRTISVIDCETDPFLYGRIPTPFIWGYYNGKEYHTFSTTKEVVEFLRERREICYAHNGGKFDWHFCVDFVEDFAEGQDVTIINGRLAKFNIGECECRDSYNILPIGLAQFEKMEFDYSILEPDKRNIPENRTKIEEYLKSDCVNLFNMVKAFIDEYGINLTLAGTALKQWKQISEKDIPKSKEYYYDYFSPYYYGGRVECFRTGLINEDFAVVDLNSAYPDAMKREFHAYGLGYKMSDSMPLLSNKNFERGFYSFIGTSKGALPWRDPETGKLEFPNDDIRREYHVTGWELKAALETKSCKVIIFIRSFMHYEFENFAKYIDYFYEKRLKAKAEGDKANDLFSKLLMNSLYGKFATNPRKYHNYHVTGDEKIKLALLTLNEEKTDGMRYAGNLGKWSVIESPLDESDMRFYNVATAASITGFVRAFLWRSIHAIGIDNVLYCDTDSLAAKSIEGLSLGEALGQWKHEGDFIYGAIAGKKLYAFMDNNGNWKTASKGARLEPEEIMEVANGGSAYYQFDAPSFSVGNDPRFIERNIMLTTKGDTNGINQ